MLPSGGHITDLQSHKAVTYRTSSPAKSKTLVIVILEDSLGLSSCCLATVEGLLGSSVPAVDVDYKRYKNIMHSNLEDN